MRNLIAFLLLLCLIPLFGCSSNLPDESSFSEKVTIATATGSYSQDVPIYKEPDISSGVIARLSGSTCLTCNLTSKKRIEKHFIRVELFNNSTFGWLDMSQCKLESIDTVSFDDSNKDRANVCRYTLRFLGAVYSDKNSDNKLEGLSCNQLVAKAYQSIGYSQYTGIKVNEYNQDTYGRIISKEELRPGDIIFYEGISGGKYSHIGIYLGKGYVIQSTVDQGGEYPQGGVHITRIIFRSSPTAYRTPFDN